MYRRSEAELPARAEEVHHAKEEGIIFDLLTNPVEILTDDNGWVKGMVVRKMELGEPDASGRRRPVEVAGSDYTIDVDAVIMSLEPHQTHSFLPPQKAWRPTSGNASLLTRATERPPRKAYTQAAMP